MHDPLRLLILGAHPDDAEFHAGGLATLYRSLGHVVRFVSVTNGDAGHHQISGSALADRRRAEADAAAAIIGADCEVWRHADGRLEPTLDVRWQVIAELRRFTPDLVLTHRTDDYHPDHRAVGHAVRDASYLVTVPALVPEVPALKRDPVVAYLPDRFTRPNSLRGDVVLDVGEQVDSIVAMLACHASQVFEWLPYNRGILEQVPAGDRERRAWPARLVSGFPPPAGRPLPARVDRRLWRRTRRGGRVCRGFRNQRIRCAVGCSDSPAVVSVRALRTGRNRTVYTPPRRVRTASQSRNMAATSSSSARAVAAKPSSAMIWSASALVSWPLMALTSSLRRNLRRWKNIVRVKSWKNFRSGIAVLRSGCRRMWMIAELTFGRGQKTVGGIDPHQLDFDTATASRSSARRSPWSKGGP